MILTTFFREYKKIFTKETLLNAEYINQQNSIYKISGNSEFDYLNEAERLIKKYAKAKLVVTSRIHCALPCLGLETPVIYTENVKQSEASACRLDGLRDFFNIAIWKNQHLSLKFNHNKEKISINNYPKNKDNWKIYASNEIDTCIKFINKK